ncbi:response regulator [Emticicia agri]|uniref:Response regulator n=1 Tax=Emticicia agri TaxID=2492393 RepID=A0A4Q5LWY2_9BACT|nr:response regulator [Emticicia agri]RYU94115.1 response regulator [Emticicia agri]
MNNALVNKYTPVEILFAEDDSDDSQLFADALAQLPFETRLNTVFNGLDVINYLNTTSSLPHIIFLDLNMPKLSGIACLEVIRKNPVYSQIPCVILSTSTNPEDIMTSYGNGANLYFAKPISFYDLKRMIDKALRLNWEHYFPPLEDSFFITEKRF